jgi:hypothetical protein
MSTDGTRPSGGPSKRPFVFLALLSIFTLAGPFAIFGILRGGPNPGWPPDRAVEWVTVGATIGLFLTLLSICLTTGLWGRRGNP